MRRLMELDFVGALAEFPELNLLCIWKEVVILYYVTELKVAQWDQEVVKRNVQYCTFLGMKLFCG